MTLARYAYFLTFGFVLIAPVVAAAQTVKMEVPKPPETGRQRLNEPQLAVDISADGRRIVCSGQNRAVRQWGVDGNELPALKNAPGGWCVAYSPDGKLIAGCGLDRIIRLWNADNGEEVRHLQGHVQIAWMAAFLPGGERLISVGEDATIRLWDVASGTESGQILGHPGPVWCMAMSADGRRLATGGADGSMRVWDLEAGKVLRLLEGNHSGGVGALYFSPDGRTLGSTGWQDHKLLLWEVDTGRLRRQVPHDGGSKFILFTPDGRTLITAGNDRAIRFWDLTDGSQWPPLEGHGGAVNGLALPPGGRTLVSVSNDQTLRTWDLTGRVMATKSRTFPARQVEASWSALARPDGRAAYDAMAALGSSPEQALALFRARLRPAASPNLERIEALIAETGHGQYVVRQKASRELEQMGEEAEGMLRRAAMQATSLETRRRAERLLQKLEARGMGADTLRGVRAVEVLERIGTTEARELLKGLAGGVPEARLTVEARASLARLDKDALTKR